MAKKVNLILVASGGGTDARAIMKAYKNGFLPNVKIIALVSTKENAGCLEEAKKLGLETHVIGRKDISLDEFNANFFNYALTKEAEMIFLVGCLVKIYPIDGIAMYNIHPADPELFGGDGMYGTEVHEFVLRHIEDRIYRGKAKRTNRFTTTPTVHEADMQYDSGQILAQSHIDIPISIIKLFMDGDPTAGGNALQQHVLPFEWEMLPGAVNLAALKILQNEERQLALA